jgi:pilus assembly protein Flp/PilA
MRNLPNGESEMRMVIQAGETLEATDGGSALARFLDDTKGSASIEYGLIAAGIAIAVLAGVQSIGTELTELYQSIVSGIYALR